MNYIKPVITNQRKVQGGSVATLNFKHLTKYEKGAFLSLRSAK